MTSKERKRLWKAAWSWWRYVDVFENPLATGYETWEYTDIAPLQDIPPLYLGVAYQVYESRYEEHAKEIQANKPFWQREIDRERVALDKLQNVASKLGYDSILLPLEEKS